MACWLTVNVKRLEGSFIQPLVLHFWTVNPFSRWITYKIFFYSIVLELPTSNCCAKRLVLLRCCLSFITPGNWQSKVDVTSVLSYAFTSYRATVPSHPLQITLAFHCLHSPLLSFLMRFGGKICREILEFNNACGWVVVYFGTKNQFSGTNWYSHGRETKWCLWYLWWNWYFYSQKVFSVAKQVNNEPKLISHTSWCFPKNSQKVVVTVTFKKWWQQDKTVTKLRLCTVYVPH